MNRICEGGWTNICSLLLSSRDAYKQHLHLRSHSLVTKDLVQFWFCYRPPAHFASCVTCSSAPAPQHWTEARVLTEPCWMMEMMEILHGVWVVAVKRTTLGSSVLYNSIYIWLSQASACTPWTQDLAISIQANSTPMQVVIYPVGLAAPGSSLSCSHCSRRYCSHYRGKMCF